MQCEGACAVRAQCAVRVPCICSVHAARPMQHPMSRARAEARGEGGRGAPPPLVASHPRQGSRARACASTRGSLAAARSSRRRAFPQCRQASIAAQRAPRCHRPQRRLAAPRHTRRAPPH
eukprot:scaffold5580_cov59-Phaeocystis_antarctica.AAC.4